LRNVRLAWRYALFVTEQVFTMITATQMFLPYHAGFLKYGKKVFFTVEAGSKRYCSDPAQVKSLKFKEPADMLTMCA
jgi:hypothetical protein